MLERLADQLNGLLKRSVRDANSILDEDSRRVVYVETIEAFKGHEGCSDSEWINGLSLFAGENLFTAIRNLMESATTDRYLRHSFHPNDKGHSEFGRLLAEAIRRDPPAGILPAA